MSSSTESVRVKILGDEYSVKGDVNSDTTKKVAEYVGRKMAATQDLQTTRDKVKTAVVSALNIAGELFEFRAQCEVRDKEIREYEQRAHAISDRIDAILSS